MPSRRTASSPRALAARFFVLAAASACPPVAARADDRPLTLPTRDVDVTYEVTRPGSAESAKLSQRIRWAAASQTMRVDTPSPGLYVIMDYRTHLLSAVRPAQRMVLQVRSDGAGVSLGGTGTKGGFAREGESSVAGLTCTDWQTRDAAGEAASVCLTADGVLLRARIGHVALVQAVQVAYGPVAADLFQIPADYRRIATPGQRP